MASQLEAFFTHGAALCGDSPSQRDAANAPTAATTNRDELLYVHAGVDAGLTTLLLQYGFTRAKEARTVVLILCGDSARSHKPKIVPVQPCLQCGVPTKTGMDNEIWRRIQIKYIKTSAELQHFACSLHLMREKSSVLLIDSFERFFGDESTGVVYQTLAMLYEARRFMATSTGYGEVVLTGSSHTFLLHDHERLHRWCRFLEITSDGDELILHEELDADADAEDANDGELDESNDRDDVAIRYRFAPPGVAGSEVLEGFVRIQEVIHRQDTL